MILTSLARAASACYRSTDWSLASVLHKGCTLLVVLVSILEHEGHFTSFLVAFDNQALVRRVSGLIYHQRNNIFLLLLSVLFPHCEIALRQVSYIRLLWMWLIGPFHLELPLIVEWIAADWTLVFSHGASALLFFTFFIKAVAKGAEITHDCFALKAVHWVNCDVESMLLLNFGRTVLAVAYLGRSGRMTRHIFNCVRLFHAVLIAQSRVPFTSSFVRLLAVFVTHGMVTAAMAMIELAFCLYGTC